LSVLVNGQSEKIISKKNCMKTLKENDYFESSGILIANARGPPNEKGGTGGTQSELYAYGPETRYPA